MKYLKQNILTHHFQWQIGLKYNSLQKKLFKWKFVTKYWLKAKNTILLKGTHWSSHQLKYLSRLLSSFYQVYTHWKTVSYVKLIAELWSNVAKNEKLFMRNLKMLATDFHIMDRKFFIGYWQRKSQCKSFGVQHAIPSS